MADNPTSINLTVVTRERKILDVRADEVVLPGIEGELGVLPGHTPLLAALKIGELRYRSGGKVERMALSWGFAEVLPDRVIVLAERGFLPGEIDLATAEAERRAAEKELADMSSNDPDFVQAEARLEESIAKINIRRAS